MMREREREHSRARVYVLFGRDAFHFTTEACSLHTFTADGKLLAVFFFHFFFLARLFVGYFCSDMNPKEKIRFSCAAWYRS